MTHNACETPRLSVVVPVFNAEAYISACLDSLSHQTMSALEVIVVDDGSTDSSLDVTRALAARDPRISVITSPNGGVSRARNAGLNASRGRYVAFVDADDWVAPTMYEELLEPTVRHPYDAVSGDLIIETPRGQQQVEQASIEGGAYDIDRIRRDILPVAISSDHLTRDWPYRMVTKVFRRDHLIENRLEFVPGLRAAQDFVFSVAAIAQAKSFYYVKGSLGYRYRWNPTSRTRSGFSTAWDNYRDVDAALQAISAGCPTLVRQLPFAEIHGDLSSLTYMYRNCRLRDFAALRRSMMSTVATVDREEGYRLLAWSRIPRDKRLICSLMRSRRHGAMHALLFLRGAVQNAQNRLLQGRAS